MCCFFSPIDVNREVNASHQVAPVPTEQAGTSINAFPFDVIRKTLENLSLSEGCNVARVCSSWNSIVQILPDYTLSVFDEKAWEHYFNLKIEGEVPPLPKHVYKTTGINRRRLAGENEAPPCTAILMPKGLTFNKLRELMQNPVNKENSTKFTMLQQNVVDEFGDEPVEESYWFVITNDVIEGSRSMSYADQKVFVGQKTENKCRLPTLLEAIACCVMHYVSSKNYLYGEDPWTFTCCQEQIHGNPVMVGGFARDGLDISRNYFLVHDDFGAAASWKC